MNRIGRIRAIATIAAAALGCAGMAAAQSPGVATGAGGTTPVQSQTPLRAEPVPPAVDAAFKASDANQDGALSLQEFRNGWRNFRRGNRQTSRTAGLRQQFDRIDADNNGGIDRDEYPDLVLIKRAGSLAPPFSEVDRNGDQKLDFAEYSGLVQRLQSSRPNGARSPK